MTNPVSYHKGVRYTRFVSYPGKRWGTFWEAKDLVTGRVVTAPTKRQARERIEREPGA